MRPTNQLTATNTLNERGAAPEDAPTRVDQSHDHERVGATS